MMNYINPTSAKIVIKDLTIGYSLKNVGAQFRPIQSSWFFFIQSSPLELEIDESLK